MTCENHVVPDRARLSRGIWLKLKGHLLERLITVGSTLFLKKLPVKMATWYPLATTPRLLSRFQQPGDRETCYIPLTAILL